MGMSSATKKVSIAIDGHEDMDISDGGAGEKICVRALFKEDIKTIDTRSKDNKSKDDIKNDCQDASKNFKIPRKFMGRKPAEVFRTDFITAMKLPEFHQYAAGDYLTLTDTWRQEWEKGVQVPVNPDKIPKPMLRKVKSIVYSPDAPSFVLPVQKITFKEKTYVAAFDRSTTTCDYDLDDIDMRWLKDMMSARTFKKGNALNELSMERAITWFERQCFEKMAHEVATKEGLSIEYDETTTCHVCLSPDAEDGNEIIFCDACNMCAHQHCYGVLDIPEGNWLCNPCSRGNLSPPCCLCPNKGGAMKRMKDSLEWIHVICAWWVPEVKIEDVRYIERITKDKIPNNRWNLTCSICWEKTGACIQCSVKRCVRAYHITCAVKSGLEMKTVVDPEKDDVQHISFCSKHCTPHPPENNPHSNRSGEDVENNRQKELRKLQCEFYTLVSVNKACRELKLSKEVTRKMLSYWTMKRRHNNNEALIPLTLAQEEKLSGKQGVVLLHEQKTLELERFLLLRQDLERLRNLCYMIVRREKMRKELHRCSIDIFMKQNDILLDKNEDLSGDNIDFIRHRTTNFARFSENYETEKEFRKVHGRQFKLFDDSSGEEGDLLKSNVIERVNPEDFDRPLCTLVEHKKVLSTLVEHKKVQSTLVEHEKVQSTLVEHKKVQSTLVEHKKVQNTLVEHKKVQTEKVHAEDTPKIIAKKNTPATETCFKPKSVSNKKMKKLNIPRRHSSRLDVIINSSKNDIPTKDSKEHSMTTDKTTIVNMCVENTGGEGSDVVMACIQTTATANIKHSEANIFELNGIIGTTETNISTTKIDAETNTSDDVQDEKMETETNDSPVKTVSDVNPSAVTNDKTDILTEQTDIERNIHELVNKIIESETNNSVTEPVLKSTIFEVGDEKIESASVSMETESETNTTPKKISERNIFEFLSPKKEDCDDTSWSITNAVPVRESCDQIPNEVEDVKPVISTNPSIVAMSHLEDVIKTVSTTELERTPLTISSPMEVKENAFDTFNEFLNDEAHQNGFSAFPDENRYMSEIDTKCNISSLKPIPNNCVLSNSSLFKRKKKRLRNILKYEGKARRNSPRLHQKSELSINTTSNNSINTTGNNTQLSPTKGSLGERLSKLIIETKRRRLNSLSDYPTDIKDEPPDYVRITRSRGVHSQVTGTA